MEERTVFGIVLAVVMFGSAAVLAKIVRDVLSTRRTVVIREVEDWEENLGI